MSETLTCKNPEGTVSLHGYRCPTCRSGFDVFLDGWGIPSQEQAKAAYEKHRVDCDREHSKVQFRKVY